MLSSSPVPGTPGGRPHQARPVTEARLGLHPRSTTGGFGLTSATLPLVCGWPVSAGWCRVRGDGWPQSRSGRPPARAASPRSRPGCGARGALIFDAIRFATQHLLRQPPRQSVLPAATVDIWPPSGHTQNRTICVRPRRRLTSRARRAESAGVIWRIACDSAAAVCKRDAAARLATQAGGRVGSGCWSEAVGDGPGRVA
jgi:hypothetical protein